MEPLVSSKAMYNIHPELVVGSNDLKQVGKKCFPSEFDHKWLVAMPLLPYNLFREASRVPRFLRILG